MEIFVDDWVLEDAEEDTDDIPCGDFKNWWKKLIFSSVGAALCHSMPPLWDNHLMSEIYFFMSVLTWEEVEIEVDNWVLVEVEEPTDKIPRVRDFPDYETVEYTGWFLNMFSSNK